MKEYWQDQAYKVDDNQIFNDLSGDSGRFRYLLGNEIIQCHISNHNGNKNQIVNPQYSTQEHESFFELVRFFMQRNYY